MIVNKLRTTASKTVGFAVAFMIFAVLMTVSTLAFSDSIYNGNTQSTSQTAEPALILYSEAMGDISVSGPVEVTLVNRGEVSTSKFFPVECSAFLQYEGIELNDEDILNVSEDTVLYDNMIIHIGSVEYATETRIEEIPFETIEIESKTVPRGEIEVVQEGVPGEVRRSYIVKYVNGVEAERAMYAEKVLSLPTEQTQNKGVGGIITSEDGTQYSYSHYKTFEATAYTYVPGKTTMTTATGKTLAKGIVAVDPKVIPLHTKMFITSSAGEYGVCQAEDTGGAIKGNIVDLAFMSYNECIQFGRRNVVIYFLD